MGVIGSYYSWSYSMLSPSCVWQDFHSLATYLSQCTSTVFLDMVSDFHLLLFLVTNEVMPLRVSTVMRHTLFSTHKHSHTDSRTHQTRSSTMFWFVVTLQKVQIITTCLFNVEMIVCLSTVPPLSLNLFVYGNLALNPWFDCNQSLKITMFPCIWLGLSWRGQKRVA